MARKTRSNPMKAIKTLLSVVCACSLFSCTSDVTAEERFELLKQYDTPKDYTYFKPEEENRRKCAEIVEISKYYKEQCEKYQLPYYETAQNREKVLEEFIKKLML